MLLFGHSGITLGAALLLSEILALRHATRPTPVPDHHSAITSATGHSRWRMEGWATSLGKRIDLRLLLVGSLLPDIIDKPVGMLFFRETFNNGRIFSHTLLFLILITSGGLYFYRRYRSPWLLVLSGGSGMHLILDEMWLTPATLFWPLYGFSFAPIDLSRWLPTLLFHLFTAPAELAGLAILIWFAWSLLRSGKVYAFVRRGQL